MYKVFVLGLIICISSCTYEVVMDESHILDSDFTYSNIQFKRGYEWAYANTYFCEASGSITNNTGVSIYIAQFELTLLDSKNRVLSIEKVFIEGFQGYTTRYFHAPYIEAKVDDISDYKIRYVR